MVSICLFLWNLPLFQSGCAILHPHQQCRSVPDAHQHLHLALSFESVQHFYASVDRNMLFILWKLLIWWMNLLLSNRWCNPTWCVHFILFIPGCIQLDNILLRVFVLMFIKNFWIVVFLYCLLFFFPQYFILWSV